MKESHFNKGDTLYYKDGNKTGTVEEVAEKGYIVKGNNNEIF